jgi:hypothetical protein
MIAEGVKSQAHGMAPEAELYAWESTNDADASWDGVKLSNHSYGQRRGWESFNGPQGPGWYWYGTVSVDWNEDFRFGFYADTAKEWDELVHNITNTTSLLRRSGMSGEKGLPISPFLTGITITAPGFSPKT